MLARNAPALLKIHLKEIKKRDKRLWGCKKMVTADWAVRDNRYNYGAVLTVIKCINIWYM